MIILKNKVYLTEINNNIVKLIYLEQDKAELIINDEYKGIVPFSYTRKKIKELERKTPLASMSKLLNQYAFPSLYVNDKTKKNSKDRKLAQKSIV